MRKLLLLTGISAALAAPALAGPKHDHENGYNLHVIADEATESAIYVITSADETVAIEVFDDDDAQWMKDADGLKALARAEKDFGKDAEEEQKGFAFSVKEDDVHIAFTLPFFKHISIHASDDDDEARVNVTSKSGEGDVFVRAHDGHAFISVMEAKAKDAREFIDDIDDAPRSMRNKMKKELGL